jgi:hypothetical protein
MATTTPIYGFDVPTSTDYVKDGATAIETLGDDVDAFLGTAFNSKLHPGLVLIKTQTIGTGVSSVTVSNAFSATYNQYRIIITDGTMSGANYGYLKLGASAASYYFAAPAFTWAGAASGLAANNASSFLYSWWGFLNGLDLTIDVKNPFSTSYTVINSSLNTANGYAAGGGTHTVAASYTDFTIGSIGAQTLTGGTIAVYGYAKD